MPLLIPNAANYPSPLTAVPSLMQDEPVEGRKQVPVEIDWSIMGGAAKAVAFNLQNNATLNISQISTIKVDNSASAADVQLIFADTADTVTIPAGVPLAVVPIFSNAVVFYAVSPNSLVGDVTRLQLLNYKQDPIDIPPTSAREIASSGGTVINGGGGGPVQLIPATVDGTLESLRLMISNPNAGASQSSISVVDGLGNIFLNAWNVGVPAIGFAALTVFDFENANWRFQNGLRMTFAAGGGAGAFIANTAVSYKVP